MIPISSRATVILEDEVTEDLLAALRRRNTYDIHHLLARWEEEIDGLRPWMDFDGRDPAPWRDDLRRHDVELNDWLHREVAEHVREGRFEHALCLVEQYRLPGNPPYAHLRSLP